MFGLTTIQWDFVLATALVAATGIIFEALIWLLVRDSQRRESPLLTQKTIRRVLRILWLLLAANIVLGVFEIQTTFTLTAISGVAALAITLSLQTMLSNMVAGLLLLRDGAIRLGDHIEFGGVKGKIVLIALRNTWVVTESGDVAIIGNSALQAGPLVNHTGTQRLIRRHEL